MTTTIVIITGYSYYWNTK